MTNPSLQMEIVKQVEQLPVELQRRVLDFTMALIQSMPKGVPGAQVLRFAGVLESDDLRVMSEQIDAGCEQVDQSEW